MTDRILSRYTRTDRDTGDQLDPDSSEVDDFGAFSFLRGVKDRAVMVEFKLKDGNSIAFDYSWLRKVEFNPSVGLTLHFGSDVVRIVGRNLHRPTRTNVELLRGIHAHRVPWIQEASEPDLLNSKADATIIEQITITSANR